MATTGAPSMASPSRRPGAGVVDPAAGPVPRHATARWLWRAAHRIRAVVGLRKGFHAGDFYYKELSPQLLTRALSRKGPGYKGYRVTFPDRSKQVLQASPARVYEDIMGAVGIDHLERARSVVRPGMRVLIYACGTGYSAAWVAREVWPSGAIVAIDEDEESITYARKRYDFDNIAFELGSHGSLGGETDGAFDAVLMLDASGDPEADDTVLGELWRVLAPGGGLFVSIPPMRRAEAVDPQAKPSGSTQPRRRPYTRPLLEDLLARACCDAEDGLAPDIEFLSATAEDVQDAIVRKPAP